MPTDVTVQVIRYHCDAYDQPPPIVQRRGGVTNVNMAKILTGMVEDGQRNHLLTALAVQHALAGRKVLCLSDRRAHCQQLKGMFEAECPNRQANLYLGGMKPEQLSQAAASFDVLYATYGLASEGLDIPVLDTLLMCSPRSSIEQAVGRVLRGAPNPLVVDVLDQFCVCFAQFRKRKAYYAKCGFALHHHGGPSSSSPIMKGEEEYDDTSNNEGALLVPDDDDV